MSFFNGYLLWLLLPLSLYLYRQPRQRLQHYLRWGALLLLVVALARPIIEQSAKEERLPAHAIVIALDLSASMGADDIKPSRAIASREVIKTFLKENLYDQISLIGFTINPLLLSPSTTDHKLVAMALDSLRSDYILTKGTELKKLLEKVASFPDAEKRLILFTDGGDREVDEALVEFAKASNIEILLIAMATQRGSTIVGKDGELLKDKAGHIVVSKFNESARGLGEVIEFEGVTSTVGKIEAWIEQQKLMESGVVKRHHAHLELFWIPTLLALILFFLSATRFSLKLLPLLLFFNINLQADSLDLYHLHQAYEQYQEGEYNSTVEELEKIGSKSLESELTLANSYYKLGSYKRARAIFKTLRSGNPKIKQQLLYSLGNCEAKLAYYDKAEVYYIKALQLGEDNDTLHNLEWVIFKKREDNSKIGFTNPNTPQASKNSNNNLEGEEEKPSSQKEGKSGSSGGEGSKKSKNSTVKVVKPRESTSHKREMSSKAYELINEGYIRESKPW